MPRWKLVWQRRKDGLCIACGKVKVPRRVDGTAKRQRCNICLDEAATAARVRRKA
jgi:hypothetical protein